MMRDIEKLEEHVYGLSWFMRMKIRGYVAEITARLDGNGNEHYNTHVYSDDQDAPTEEEIIQAYKELF